MESRWISADGVTDLSWPDAIAARQRSDGFLWIDAGVPDDATAALLADTFGFHRLTVRDMVERHHLPKIHAYPDHIFVVLNGPERGDGGHVHLVELDMFIGRDYLVTTHGPLGVGVTVEAALHDTSHVLERLISGRASAATPFELSYLIVCEQTIGEETYLGRLAAEVAALEQRVRSPSGDPVKVLDQMFLVRHELLSIRTIAAESREIYARMASLHRVIPPEAPPLIQDVIDRFERIRALCDDEKEFAQGVIDFYQAQTTTRMNMAMERLALIAAVVLPVTAIASIYGMNIIVGESTDVPQLILVLAFMGLVTGGMLAWAKRMHWW